MYLFTIGTLTVGLGPLLIGLLYKDINLLAIGLTWIVSAGLFELTMWIGKKRCHI